MGKRQYTIRIPEECAKWLDGKVKNRIYANPTHGIEVCIREQMRKEGLIKDE